MRRKLNVLGNQSNQFFLLNHTIDLTLAISPQACYFRWTYFSLRQHEIIGVQFHLDRIHSGTGWPGLCWIYTGTAPTWNYTASNWITFMSEPI